MANSGPGRYSQRQLTDEEGRGLRRSKLRGRLHRLLMRQNNTPADRDGYHYIKAGSLK